MSAIRSPAAAIAWNGAFAEDVVPVRRDVERTGAQTSTRADARPRYADCIPVRSLDRIVIVRVQAIVRLEADDNYVRIWADRMYLHKETLARLCARLDPARFSCACTARTPCASTAYASSCRGCTASTCSTRQASS